MKRAEPGSQLRDAVKKVYGELADLLTSEESGHQHGITLSKESGEITYYVSYAIGLMMKLDMSTRSQELQMAGMCLARLRATLTL